jgi:hypothetical protein
MRYSVGILIIGSLCWDPKRKWWRDSRLHNEERWHVSSPIRYGRLSSTRGDTYTMVFSRLCEAGQAIAARCRHDVERGDDLIAEAQALWSAEINVPGSHHLSKNWGRTALLINPDSTVPQDIVEAYVARIRREPGYRDVPQSPGEGPLISERGILRIPWPIDVPSGQALRLDLLLATANYPDFIGDPRGYPDAGTIADAWRRDTAGNVLYFHRNRAEGIRTFEDDAISALLQRPQGQE